MQDAKPFTIKISPVGMEELVNRAFRAGSEAAENQDVAGLRPVAKARIKEKARLKVAAKRIVSSLSRLEASIPPRSALTPFYRELLDTLGGDRLEDARLRIGRACRAIERIAGNALTSLNRAGNSASMQTIRKRAYGRISSEARSLIPVINYLAELSPKLREVPAIKPGTLTVVIGGYPNVGKTTLLKALTGSSPEIRPFPFTTKTIQLGYYQCHWRDVQVIDTPGLLDRPIEKKNPVELRAIQAMMHLADVIVFMVDPTTTCGFLLEEQVALLQEVKRSFPAPIIVIINKVDIASEDEVGAAKTALGDFSAVLEVSSTRGDGIEKLREEISSYLIEKAPKPKN